MVVWCYLNQLGAKFRDCDDEHGCRSRDNNGQTTRHENLYYCPHHWAMAQVESDRCSCTFCETARQQCQQEDGPTSYASVGSTGQGHEMSRNFVTSRSHGNGQQKELPNTRMPSRSATQDQQKEQPRHCMPPPYCNFERLPPPCRCCNQVVCVKSMRA